MLDNCSSSVSRNDNGLVAQLTGLGGLFQVTVDSHAGEAENRRLDHLDDWL